MTSLPISISVNHVAPNLPDCIATTLVGLRVQKAHEDVDTVNDKKYVKNLRLREREVSYEF
jgi:hypothetical protein